jgi:hypothetical protein
MHFLRSANDTIQPPEKSAGKRLICNERNFRPCGLRVLDAGRGREKTGPERVEWVSERAVRPDHEVRRFPQKPRARDPAMKKANGEWLAFLNRWWMVATHKWPSVSLFGLVQRHTRSMRIAANSGLRFVQIRNDSVTHCPVPALALVPHSEQCRAAGVDEIQDSHIGLGDMLAVQAAGMLLQGCYPRHGYRHNQRVERWVGETLANRLSRLRIPAMADTGSGDGGQHRSVATQAG